MNKLICISLISCTQALWSQILVQGSVYNNGAEPVQNALVEFINQADSSQKFAGKTDTRGQYSIRLILTYVGQYPNQAPTSYTLHQNYPNPFNPSTIITYELLRPSEIKIEIHNVLGQKIKTLVDGFQTNLHGRVSWDGTNDWGNGVSAGVYIYSLKAASININKKMLLLDGHSGSFSDGASLRKSSSSAQTETMIDAFLLRVSGRDLITYNQPNIVFGGDSLLKINVIRMVKDIDGNIYRTVKIGNQWWMQENLRVTHYRNGNAINIGTGLGSYRNDISNDSSLTVLYGRYYNGEAAKDSRSIAPKGWHVARINEFQDLINFLGGREIAGGKLKEAGHSHWLSPNTGATNESGFTALPAGIEGGLYYRGQAAFFLDLGTTYMHSTQLYYDHADVPGLASSFGFASIRCVRDTIPISASFTASPQTGSTTTEFQFNASAALDELDDTEALKVRWDWENDGYWDTPFSTVKQIMHQYASQGVKEIKLEAQNTYGYSTTATGRVWVGNANNEIGIMEDTDGNVYRTAKIGNQWWMAENLKVTHFRNGDEIPNSGIQFLTTPAYTIPYFMDVRSAPQYGNLYNWYAVIDSRGLAPQGWRIPTQADWEKLSVQLGGYSVAGGKMKEPGTTHWKNPNSGATNESGFYGLPAGGHYYGARFDWPYSGNSTHFWSSTIKGNPPYDYPFGVGLYYSNENLSNGFITHKDASYSVRCIKD